MERRFIIQGELKEYHKAISFGDNFLKLANVFNDFQTSFERLIEEKGHKYLEYYKMLKESNVGEAKKSFKVCLNSLSSKEREIYDSLYTEIENQLNIQGKKNFGRVKELAESLARELTIGFNLNSGGGGGGGPALDEIQFLLQFQFHFQLKLQSQYQQQQDQLKYNQDILWIENQFDIEIENQRNSIIIEKSLIIKRIIEVLLERFI